MWKIYFRFKYMQKVENLLSHVLLTAPLSTSLHIRWTNSIQFWLFELQCLAFCPSNFEFHPTRLLKVFSFVASFFWPTLRDIISWPTILYSSSRLDNLLGKTRKPRNVYILLSNTWVKACKVTFPTEMETFRAEPRNSWE